MIRYLTLAEVVDLHEPVVGLAGGAHGLRDLSALEAAIAQPRAGFGSTELYSGLAAKAAALDFSLILNTRSSTATSAPVTRPWRRSSC